MIGRQSRTVAGLDPSLPGRWISLMFPTVNSSLARALDFGWHSGSPLR